jgi:metal-responsive CopG/Arc/MetJ family transcriptional regulator
MARIMISLPKEFLEMIDAAAKMEHRSRSELIREAVRGYISKKGGASSPLLDDKEVKWAVRVQDQSRKELKNLKVNTTEIVRKFRGRI